VIGVYAEDPDQDEISQLLLYYGGQFTGLIFDVPGNEGTVFVQQSLAVGPGVPAGEYLLELRVRDRRGKQSSLWPHLESSAAQGAAGSAADGFLLPERPWIGWPELLGSALAVGDDPAAAPMILLGGFMNSEISEEAGGQLNFVVVVQDPQGYGDIDRVELFFGGRPTGVTLADDGQHGDFSAGDGVFGLQFDLAPGDVPAGSYLLECAAFDLAGNRSALWPYLTSHPGATPPTPTPKPGTPTPTPTATPTPTPTPKPGTPTPTPTATPTPTPTPKPGTPTPTPTAVPEDCLDWTPEQIKYSQHDPRCFRESV